MVEELTTIALKIEGLPDTDFVRSTAWTYIHEYEAENVFKGGRPQNANGITVEISVFKGGLDFDRKGKLIESFTHVIQKNTQNRMPIYILIKEFETEDWGVLGKRITLDELFNPTHTKPI
ncbi:tautomerase family protein [Fulvivirga sediminis]|uniref:Tautomerase family protein n=1 Tax=Fulvivirga sediminis TaxID=2803949 RepID=A0A937F8S8_9BACT|nr:tautomerase family protein [Fulvivirga sediminis]MBL3656128.1 tautomerase family protein [Fulvivirga sediminis]